MCLIMTDRGWAQLGDGVVCVNHNCLEGVFRPQTIEDAQFEVDCRADKYEQDVQRYLDGDLPKEKIFRAFDAPMYGAFGERL